MVRIRTLRFRQPSLNIVSSLLVLLICSFLLSSCAQSTLPADAPEKISLPPITESATNIYLPGKIVWHDLLTNDASAARKFYGALFGWTFESKGTYTLILQDGHQLGGIIQRKIDKPVWLASISVPDVDKALETALAMGSTVLTGPLDIDTRGRGALIRDPQGAYIVLLHAHGGDPVDTPPALNSWLWDELWTPSPKDSTAFYKAVAGYDSSIQGDEYQILAHKEQWRCGIRPVDKKSRWVPIVRVDDLQATADKAEELGGKIWIRPGESVGDEDAALIADSTGALLIIQRWSMQPATGGK